MKAMRRRYRSLMEDTAWEQLRRRPQPACDNCMAHCGFEGTAVDDAFAHPLKALKVLLRGPAVDGPDGAGPAVPLRRSAPYGAGGFGDTPPAVATIPVAAIKRASRRSESRRAGRA